MKKKIIPKLYKEDSSEPKVTRKRTPFRPDELKWETKESEELEQRILNLSDDQIAALFYVVDIKFSKENIPKVIQEIRETGEGAIHLGTLLSEADSKENLLWWVDYFTKANHKR